MLNIQNLNCLQGGIQLLQNVNLQVFANLIARREILETKVAVLEEIWLELEMNLEEAT